MRHHPAVLGLALTTGIWPALAAYASDSAPLATVQAPGAGQSHPLPAVDRPPHTNETKTENGAAGPQLDSVSLASRRDGTPDGKAHGLAHSPSLLRGSFRLEGGVETASVSARSTGMAPQHAPPSPGATGLKLLPNLSGTRTGWHMSGRVGPLRWLSPLEGEGEATVKLGGRVKDQPRMPGLGLFNVGIHYNFE